MRRLLLASVLASAALAGTAVLAAEREPVIETPPHGLGLLLDTPASPVGGIYSEPNRLT